MNRVFNDADLGSSEKLVMLSLADNANDDGVCFPSISTLQKKTSLTRPTVCKVIKNLTERRVIFGVKRSRKKGGRSSTMYLLFPYENYPKLDEIFKDKFEELSTEIESQSKEALLPPQSKVTLLGKGSQSKATLLESEPSLKRLFNHKGFSCLSNREKEVFLEYLKLRTKMGLKTTYEIKDRLLKKYHQFGRDISIIEKAINSNWKDFYEPHQRKFGEGRKSTAQMHHETLKRIHEQTDEQEMGEFAV